MPRKLLAVASILTLLLAAFVLANGRTQSASADPAIDSEEQAFMTLINQWRAQNGAGPLTFTTSINNAAEWMNNDMGTKGYFSHTDSLGQSPWTRMCNFGYCYNTWRGENIAAGYTTAASVFAAWKASSGHNANMLNPNFKTMGLSRLYVSGSPYGWYWTNDFGGVIPPSQPAAPTATPAPTPSRTPSPAPTASPAPTVPPGFGCTGDYDCDGWSDFVEGRIGTNPSLKCSTTFTANDEAPDSLPVDLNDDRAVNVLDITAFIGAAGKVNTRLDLNGDGKVNVLDVTTISRYLSGTC